MKSTTPGSPVRKNRLYRRLLSFILLICSVLLWSGLLLLPHVPMARLMLMKMQQAGAAGLFPILRKRTDYDSHDIYLPFISWHNRFMYDKEKTDRYNEMPGCRSGCFSSSQQWQLECTVWNGI